ncbi:MAG TPA: hypothetical protein PKC70_10965, partial [Cellvibrionaceae bacterium]|nr:hypothetical protein [Cellvibrionaceae bacterium]
MQEQLPSLHAVNEHFFGKFNDARASKVIFLRFLTFAALKLAKMCGFPCFRAAHGGLHLWSGIHAAIINPALNAAGLI